jgi:2'-5' RNA ligase
MLQNNTLLQNFLKFAINRLQELKQIKFNSYPKIVLTVDKSKLQTLANFNPNNNQIMCYTPKRLVADVYRSLAHELVHFAQNLKQELDSNSGNTGSNIENEANSIAGIIMREFGSKFPEIFVTSFDETVEQNDEHIDTDFDNDFENRTDKNLIQFATRFLDKLDSSIVQKVKEKSTNFVSSLYKSGTNLVQESETKSDTGCLMLDLKFNNWNKFLKQIPDEDLYTDEEGYSKELEPHCTVLYGFDQSVDVNKVKKYLQTLSEPIKLSLNKIDLFENEKFDVVKFSVVSKDLNKLHKFLKNNFENNETFDTYSPHVTIAYVKKGFGKKFVTNKFEPIELDSTQFTYSLGKSLEKVKIDIGSSLNEVDNLVQLGEEFLNESASIDDEEINELLNHIKTNIISEALYQGKSVTLNKPTQGDVKKFKVYVKNKSGKVIKVNFGSKDYNIKKNNPDRKKSYCARSKGIEGGGTDKTKANYWSRRQLKC